MLFLSRYDLFTNVKLAKMFGCGFVHQVSGHVKRVQSNSLFMDYFLLIQKVNIWLWPHTLFFHCLFVYRSRTEKLESTHNGSRIKMTEKSKLPRYFSFLFICHLLFIWSNEIQFRCQKNIHNSYNCSYA